MVIFHSYVSLPEGTCSQHISACCRAMFSLKTSMTFGTASIDIHSIDKLSGCFHRLANVKKKLFVCLNDCIKAGMCLTGCWKCTQTWLSLTSFSQSYFLKHYFQLPAMTRFSSSIWNLGRHFLEQFRSGTTTVTRSPLSFPLRGLVLRMVASVVKFRDW